MTKREVRQLRSLQKKLVREAIKKEREASRKYNKGGYSYDDGAGDEGWTESFRLYGLRDGLIEASIYIEKFLKNLEDT